MDTNPLIKVESAADALDQIRSGSNHVLLVANQRLAEVRDALDKGHFIDALEAMQHLMGKIGQLANAQQAMGLFAQNAMVRVADLEEGMVIPGVGEIKDVGPCPGCGHENCNNMAFTVGEQVITLDRDVEIVVEKK